MTTNDKLPELKGLVLAGGRSTRMGQDKGTLRYRSVPHREYLYDLIAALGLDTYLSVRADQTAELDGHYPTIVDNDRYRGVYNGMLSAHHRHPEAAWLVVATDLSLIEPDTLRTLVQQRNAQQLATAFASEDGLPEPLCTIWEPAGLRRAEQQINEQQMGCPRKFLIRTGVPLLPPAEQQALYNANRPEDYEHSLRQLAQRS